MEKKNKICVRNQLELMRESQTRDSVRNFGMSGKKQMLCMILNNRPSFKTSEVCIPPEFEAQIAGASLGN